MPTGPGEVTKLWLCIFSSYQGTLDNILSTNIGTAFVWCQTLGPISMQGMQQGTHQTGPPSLGDLNSGGREDEVQDHRR